MDPALRLLSAAGLVAAMRKWRESGVALAWAAAMIVGLFAFRYRSNYYLLPLLPVMAALAAITGGKLASPSAAWGIPAVIRTRLPVASALDNYCARHRGNGLILVTVEDQFYSSILPLSHVRYCFLTAPAEPGLKRPYMDFERLGISASVSESEHMDARLTTFQARSATFDLPSTAPLATVVRATTLREVERPIDAQTGSDFFLP